MRKFRQRATERENLDENLRKRKGLLKRKQTLKKKNEEIEN